MIQIKKGIINSVTVTLSEKTTLTSIYYLFEFTPKGNNIPVYCVVGSDKNTNTLNPKRYNEFDITETSSPDPLNSEIELPVGESVYKVYEQSNNVNLNPTGLNCVEGPMRCWVTVPINTDTQIQNSDLTNIEVHAGS